MQIIFKLIKNQIRNLEAEISIIEGDLKNNSTNMTNCKNEIEELKEFMKHNTRTTSDPVIDELKLHYDARQKQGLEKYGTNLHENRDDDFLNHALEEAMDLTAYLKKLQMQTRFESLNQKVLQWADEKGILSKGNSNAQHEKTLEEVQELTDALAANDEFETIDAIGDIVVTLIIQCKMKGLNIVDCLDSAYDVISKRTGNMVEGTFVKDE